LGRPISVIGLLGTTLDRAGARRWDRWRPTVSLVQRQDVEIDRIELLHDRAWRSLAQTVAEDVASASPGTAVTLHEVGFEDPWDLEGVYATLLEWAEGAHLGPDEREYWVHITTGTHIAQICLFLLVEAGFVPGKLVQTSPPGPDGQPGLQVIDLDLARYDRIAGRFAARRQQAVGFLKGGIDTRSPSFNRMIDRLERVVLASDAPVLLTGPTGAGKSQLARRIYALQRERRVVKGPLVEVNCATIRGDGAMSALFGHVRGAFTGAVGERRGLLGAADGGVLFLDEVGELGLDEQAMLLRAVEDKRFLPLGSDREVGSNFRLVAGTNRDLSGAAREGRFREDLLARLDLWTFRLPGLAERPEDLEPNLDFELEQLAARTGRRVRLNREARQAFLAFARTAPWPRNFRDLGAAVTRLGTLCEGGRVDRELVEEEIARLRAAWGPAAPAARADRVGALFGPDVAMDRFDRVQLEEVLAVCAASRSLSEAGRTLFAASRTRRTSRNDADRLRKYLQRFGLGWEDVSGARGAPAEGGEERAR
jgi:transcriptional regulatory protein RtcR